MKSYNVTEEDVIVTKLFEKDGVETYNIIVAVKRPIDEIIVTNKVTGE